MLVVLQLEQDIEQPLQVPFAFTNPLVQVMQTVALRQAIQLFGQLVHRPFT
jgi:hypothetical protein